ncbi:MAG TPA: hypothetical protein VE077_21355, partial [Candidatus Methylomirabilis sp.]|nr:hypothetical protein [Candidatus Methylomirabilis sp.]
LAKDIGDNVFFKPFRHRRSGDEIAWETKPVRMPQGTEIQFLQDSDGYAVCLRRPDHYRVDFSVKAFAGTGAGDIPKYFLTSHASTTMQWTFIITMRYSIENPEDSTFNPSSYVQWLDSLFEGLRRQVTVE